MSRQVKAGSLLIEHYDLGVFTPPYEPGAERFSAIARLAVDNKQCREPTCYSFAIKLVASQKKLTSCPPLTEPAYAEQRVDLQDLVIDAPAIG